MGRVLTFRTTDCWIAFSDMAGRKTLLTCRRARQNLALAGGGTCHRTLKVHHQWKKVGRIDLGQVVVKVTLASRSDGTSADAVTLRTPFTVSQVAVAVARWSDENSLAFRYQNKR